MVTIWKHLNFKIAESVDHITSSSTIKNQVGISTAQNENIETEITKEGELQQSTTESKSESRETSTTSTITTTTMTSTTTSTTTKTTTSTTTPQIGGFYFSKIALIFFWYGFSPIFNFSLVIFIETKSINVIFSFYLLCFFNFLYFVV